MSMSDLFVVKELKAYLISHGIGQDHNDPVSNTIPSIIIDPFDGAPEPRNGECGTVTIVDTMQRAADTLEAWIEETFIDVIVRHRSPFLCRQLHRRIFDLLHPIEAHGGRMQWQMNDLEVLYSTVWRTEQPLPYPTDGNTDIVSRVRPYRIGCRRKALAGTPLAP